MAKEDMYNWMDYEVGIKGEDRDTIDGHLKAINEILTNYPSSKDHSVTSDTAMARFKDIIELAIESLPVIPKDTVIESIVNTRAKINAMPGGNEEYLK